MKSRLTTSTALGAVFISGLLLAACGNSVPGNAVARVGDAVITRADFDHWLRVAAISSAQTVPGQKPQKVVVPDPPNFTACIAQKRATTPKPTKGLPAPTTADLKAQCQQDYASLRDQVMSFLISSDWIVGEAADQGIKVSQAEIRTRFNQIKNQQFPKAADFQKFLQTSGMTLNDLFFRVKLIVLSDKLRNKVTKGKDKVSNATIASYYAHNKSRYSQPQRRDLQIVLTKALPQAQKAKHQIQSGQSFASVAKRLSIDQASKNQGGTLLGVAKGQQEQPFDNAVFSAKQGVLSGPVKTSFGFYVFRVTRIIPASQETEAQAAPEIRALLSQQAQQNALQTFITHYQAKWKGRTNCRTGFVVQTCSNYHAPKTQGPSLVPGAPPQGAPPQGAPPQGAPPQGAPPQGAPPQGGSPQGAPPQGGSQGGPPRVGTGG